MLNTSTIIIFVLLEGIGVYLLYKALSIRHRRNQAIRWPTVEATLLESTLVEEPIRNAIGNLNVSYVLHVKYEYTVAGVRFEGDRVSFGKPAFNFITGSNLQSNYETGRKVPVYYNPKDPADCLLAPKTTVGMPSRMLGSFFIVTGIVMLIIVIIT